MSLSIGLSLYIGRIRRKHELVFLPLDRFDGHTDFIKLLASIVKTQGGQYIDVGDGRRRIQINDDLEAHGRALDGTADVGEYGIRSTLRDEDGAESFERQPVHSEMLPLYYRAWSPQGQDFCLFALQKFGHHGLKTALQRFLISELKERFPDYIFEMREAVSRSMINHYLENGAVKEFTFLQHGVPSDWADGYGGEPLNERQAELEIRIKAKRGQRFPFPERFRRYFLGEGISSTQLFEIGSFQCDTFKVKVEVNGQTKTLSHTEFINMTSRVDISDDVDRDESGHPTRESIRPLAIELLKQLAGDVSAKK